MALVPKSQQLFYLVIGAAIVAASMVIITAHGTKTANPITTQAITQEQMSQDDDIDSIQKDLDNTNLDNVDSEMQDIDSQLSY